MSWLEYLVETMLISKTLPVCIQIGHDSLLEYRMSVRPGEKNGLIARNCA